MNSLPSNAAFRDRFVAVRVPGYSSEEKVSMLGNYIVPEILKRAKMPPGFVSFNAAAARALVHMTGDSDNGGVRQLKFAVEHISRMVQFVAQNRAELSEFKLSFLGENPIQSTGGECPCYVIDEDFVRRAIEEDPSIAYPRNTMYI